MNRLFVSLSSAVLLALCAGETLAQPKSPAPPKTLVQSKTAVKSSKSVAHRKAAKKHYSSCLVPPPPAYMPSILADSAIDGASEGRPQNPNRKYVYARQGYELPTPVETRKGVTTY